MKYKKGTVLAFTGTVIEVIEGYLDTHYFVNLEGDQTVLLTSKTIDAAQVIERLPPKFTEEQVRWIQSQIPIATMGVEGGKTFSRLLEKLIHK